MKSLTNYISEKLIVNKNYNTYQYYPATWKELRQIVKERFEELGPGTKNEPIDFNDIDVSRITTFYSGGPKKIGIFQFTKFEYIDISDWDVSNIENMQCMFCNCKSLKSIGDISNWKVSKVKYMGNMFRNCENLKSIGDLSNWDVSNIEGMRWMFIDSGITNMPRWYKE